MNEPGWKIQRAASTRVTPAATAAIRAQIAEWQRAAVQPDTAVITTPVQTIVPGANCRISAPSTSASRSSAG